jgi:hypothetical protein
VQRRIGPFTPFPLSPNVICSGRENPARRAPAAPVTRRRKSWGSYVSDTATRSNKRIVLARRAAIAAVPVTLGALLIPTLANAATTSGQLTGCLKKSTGVLSYVKAGTSPVKACGTGTVKVTWNVKGAKGATGATGPQGPKGDKGASGLQGIQGIIGATGATGPAGPAGGLAGYEVVQKTIGAGDLLGLTNQVTVVCPTGKMALSGGMLSGLPLVGSLLSNVLGTVPLLDGSGFTTVTNLTPLLGDTFYSVCVTATSAVPSV